MSNVLINQGTQTAIKTDTVGTELYQVIKVDVGAAGASSPFTGTFFGGTLNNGTINTGTVDSISLLPTNNFATVINTTSNSFGTIKPAVAGSALYITDITISAGSATNVAIYNGSTGNVLYGTFQFAQNGGLVSNFRVPLVTTSGSAITYQQSQSGGPLNINIQGFIR